MIKKTPHLHDNLIYWVIADTCNYSCSYCIIKRKQPLLVNPLQTVESFRKNLKGKWEIIISGGEPFLHKDFLETVKKLVGLGHRISVYTNFSAKPEKIIEFLKITEGKLSGFFASLHLEYAKPENFLEKISQIEKASPGFKKRLFVCSVGLPKKLNRSRDIKRKFFEKGVQVIIMATQYSDRSFFQYSDSQKKLLSQINGNCNLPEFGIFAAAYSGHGVDASLVSFKGRECSAGHKSFFVNPLGDAYSCVTANRAKKWYLGNLLQNNFRLKKTDVKCPFDRCSCPIESEQHFWWKDYVDKKNSIGIK